MSDIKLKLNRSVQQLLRQAAALRPAQARDETKDRIEK